ncbi:MULTISPECIES: LeoA/HP0731 family dynamin-like GTPase [Proteus]|jgi:GTP-binding protein EngB required for normal cell division|uniref:50S ribosome-binding GTPase n=1 Tax=Proteus terrae subsp. cibarius TaxID=626774 RepID=A0A8I0WT09_9GAMM|nr:MULTISPECIES: LeoA/HP0731 family dynamin-like GTPase [Proteus]QHP76450.1 labile enterotoxin output A [Proteus vulgaris]MBG2914529.1 50S ribosome-binding GTPase [Proteus terrae subsp. cibarius]MCM2366121.1 50S ribosome-binding GTPase [Proteus sp. FZP2095]UXA36006.1 50S ribosome-binding GTPase [Proteus terrae]WCG92125.1 50S ribosome-binding GTPase [Proteus terrae]
MKHTLTNFNEKQTQILNLLNRLLRFLQQGTQAGVSIDPSLIKKLENNIAHVVDEKLKVALIGGFSEGKTSIAAAWMEKLDKSTMKISHQESSNEVKVYEIGEEFVLIDTPGLFGFKEQQNAQTFEVEKYKDLTKKHVSDAHLVLYVMNSTNPIKESHKEDMYWLFRTLNLLPRTIFVLSRFDEVADVEDEDDYQENLNIKQQNVIGRLQDMISLTQEEINTLSIVAVAANPFDEGIDYWLENIEQFKALSHITHLQTATANKITQNGGSEALDAEMRTSVISDILHKQLPIAIDANASISHEVGQLEKAYQRLDNQMRNTQAQISETQITLSNFVTHYFADLIMQAKGCSIETFSDFYEREIGDEGIMINNKLQNEFRSQMGVINLEVEKIQTSFDSEVSHFNNTIKSLGKMGINNVLKGNFINNKTVLATRDGIVSVAKTVGLDIGKYLKFKPYGAINFAKGANAALAAVGVIIEIWDSYDKYKKEEQFKQVIDDMVKGFNEQRSDLVALIDSPEFAEKFFANYITLNNQIKELGSNLSDSRERENVFSAWLTEAKLLESELVTLF